MSLCRNCQFNNPDEMNFCGKCGQSLLIGNTTRPVQEDGSVSLPAYAHRQPRDYTPAFILESVLHRVPRRHLWAGKRS